MILAPAHYRPGPVVWAANIAATCLVLFAFQRILWLVIPFIFALLIYYALLPLKVRLVLRGRSHETAAAWVSVIAFSLMGLILLFGLPTLVGKAVNWQESAARYLDAGMHLMRSLLLQFEGRFSFFAKAHLSREMSEEVRAFTAHFAEKYLPVIAMGLASWSPSLVLGPFIAFFMLRDGWRFRRFLIRAVPNAYFERCLYLMSQVDRTARLYFVGLMQLTVLDTCCLAFGLWLIGVSAPLLLGVVTAVLAWIPYVGSIVGCLLVVLVAATDFPSDPGVVYAAVGLFVIVRLLDDFIFMPMTIGKSLNMHPLLTVLMIFVGGAVAGVPGLMLVLPVLGIIMVLGETIGQLLTDSRLRARHKHAQALQQKLVTQDLRIP